jgi:hypothetical protein
MLDWKRLQNELVDEGEDRRVGADAQSERKEGYGQKDRRLAERAQGILEILQNGGHQ